MTHNPCIATLTLKDGAKSYSCIETGKDHTRHVFDLGLQGRREFEFKAVATAAVAGFTVRWLEV